MAPSAYGDGPPHHVAGEQERTEQLAAPDDGRGGERHLQVGRRAERGLDHAADIARQARRLGDAGDGKAARQCPRTW